MTIHRITCGSTDSYKYTTAQYAQCNITVLAVRMQGAEVYSTIDRFEDGRLASQRPNGRMQWHTLKADVEVSVECTRDLIEWGSKSKSVPCSVHEPSSTMINLALLILGKQSTYE
jgi:hypothetical protein